MGIPANQIPRRFLPTDVRAKAAPAARGMNKWERSYADFLEAQRKAGSVLWWDFERIRIRVGKGAWYKCDFAVLRADGLSFEEVKGHWREAAKVRIKAAADLLPFPFYVVRPGHGGWQRDRV